MDFFAFIYLFFIDGFNNFSFYCLLMLVVIWCNYLSLVAVMVFIFNGLSAIVCVNRICFVLVLPYVFAFITYMFFCNVLRFYYWLICFVCLVVCFGCLFARY